MNKCLSQQILVFYLFLIVCSVAYANDVSSNYDTHSYSDENYLDLVNSEVENGIDTVSSPPLSEDSTLVEQEDLPLNEEKVTSSGISDYPYEQFIHTPEVPTGSNFEVGGRYNTNLFTGAAAYTYQIKIPPGTNRLTPSLSLTYNSQDQGVPGIVGSQWSMSDNYIKRNVNYTPSDTSDDSYELVLNNVFHNLIFDTGDNYYHTQIESYLKITNLSSAPNLYQKYWLITDKDGTSYRFGYDHDSEAVANQTIQGYFYPWKWYLDKINDTHGNTIYFSYTEGSDGVTYPHSITYNSEQLRKINFTYETRPDTWTVFDNGHKMSYSQRLKQINVYLNNTLVRKYVLNYTTNDIKSRSYISQIQEYGTDGTSTLPPTKFEYTKITTNWHNNTNWSIPSYAEFGDDQDEGVRLFDITGDGLIDMMVSRQTSSESWENFAYINNGSSFISDSNWDYPEDEAAIVDDYNIDTGARFGDFNGDGRTDIIKANDFTQIMYQNTGEGWLQNPPYEFPEELFFMSYSPLVLDRGVRLADINGDGWVDALRSQYNDNKRCWINNGGGWDSVYTCQPDEFFVLSDGEDEGVRLADVNGDGLTDLLYAEGGYRATHINTRDSWEDDSRWEVPTNMEFVQEDDGDDRGVRIADVNGDGLPDLVRAQSSTRLTYLNNGSGWVLASQWDIPTGMEFVKSSGTNKGVRIADIDGDGSPDLIKSYDGDEQIWINNVSHPYLLSKVTNTFGGQILIEYVPSTLINNTGGDNISDLGYNRWVVSDITLDNNMTNYHKILSRTNYSYEGGYHDYIDREFRGFAKIVESKFDNLTIAHKFYQDDAKKGLEYETETYNKILPYQKISNSYATALNNGIYSVERSQEKIYVYDGTYTDPKIYVTNYSYDGYGNINKTSFFGDSGLSGDEYYQYLQYSYNSSAWILNKIKSESLRQADDSTVVYITNYSYDSQFYNQPPLKGDVTRIKEWLNTGNNPITQKYYDAYGNTVVVTDPRGHNTSFEYDSPTNTYPVLKKDALNHITLTNYDLSTGNVLTTTDTSNVKTSHTYDVFGRLTKEVEPYDSLNYSTKLYEYSFDGIAPERVTTKSREVNNTANTFDVYDYVDGFGNTLQEKRESESSNFIVQNYFYDNEARLNRITNAFKTGSSTSYEAPSGYGNNTHFNYDVLNRLTTVVNPDSSIKQIHYDHQYVDLYDELLNRSRFKLDAYGRIVQVSEYNNQLVYTTSYEYDVLGNLIEVQNNEGDSLYYSYDSLGRKISMADPDMGNWTYTYDSASNLINQTNSENQSTVFSYDELNRIQVKSGSDEINYYYDEQKNNTLSRLVMPGYSINYTYDDKNRITEELKDVGGYNFATNYKYDSLNRVTSITLPDASEIKYDYNNQNQLNGITDVLANIDYNNNNQITKREYNNSLLSTRSYDPLTLRLLTIITDDLQSLQYEYDSASKIIQVVNNITNETQSLSYDGLQRLASATFYSENASSNYNYIYNSIGNLEQIDNDDQYFTFSHADFPVHAPIALLHQIDQTQCGEVIFSDINLSNDLDYCSGDGLIVGADNILIDCNGKTISSSQHNGYGVLLNGKTNVAIQNCSISGFYAGIMLNNSNQDLIISNTLYDNNTYGIFLENSTYNMFSNNQFINNINSAYEDSSSNNNAWNLSDTGNYWSDFINNSGYPQFYNISGDGDGIDYHPITKESVIGISMIYPSEELDVMKNEFFNYSVQVCCYEDDCGDIQVSLDPEIQLQDADSEILEDATFDEDSTSSGSSVFLTADLMDGTGAIPFIKFNISSIPENAIIENVTLCLREYYASENDLDVWYVSNQTWTEEELDSYCNNSIACADLWNMLTTRLVTYNGDESANLECITGLEWAVQTEYDSGHSNVSFALNNTGPNNLTYYHFYSKEYFLPPYRPYLNIAYSFNEKGLVSNVSGSTPFYTNGSNPLNISLQTNNCQNVSWWVKATGLVNSTHAFFTYANLTSNPSIGNQTEIINITIIEPVVSVNNLSAVYSMNTQRRYKFTIRNVYSDFLNDVTWTLFSGESNVSSINSINLSSNDSLFVYVDCNYSSPGTYNVTAYASSSEFTDSETIEVTI